MPLETVSETVNGKEHIYSWDDSDPKNTRKLVFKIDEKREVVEFFPRSQDFPPTVFDGFRRVPAELNEGGYIRTGGVQYYLGKKLSEANVRELRVIRQGAKALKKNGKSYRMSMPYPAFFEVVDRIKNANSSAQFERRSIVDAALHGMFPRKFSVGQVSARRTLNRLLASLDEAVVSEMNPEEVERFLDFTKTLLEKKYTRADKRRDLFTAAKLKVDDVALTEVITEFETLLGESPNESKWGEFLCKNLFLVESRYVHIIERLNVVLASAREVDFGLVDSHGYLDLFEIKKPDTRLLAASQDRGNHYWHAEAVKAIVQAEKYLHNAMQNALTLADGIRRERQLDVRVIRPRAVVIMGNSGQLDTPSKKDDFRVLRTSLRHIEIILYDELLTSLKNQKSKIYVN
jgi:hypothetical protein